MFFGGEQKKHCIFCSLIVADKGYVEVYFEFSAQKKSEVSHLCGMDQGAQNW